MKMRILKALLRKEIKLMRRNPIIPKIIVMMPLMVMLVMPLVANLDVKQVNVTVVDNDRSDISRRITANLQAADNIDVLYNCTSYDAALRTMEDGSADVILCIPYRFAADMLTAPEPLDILANGVNANKGMLGARYVAQSVAGTMMEIRRDNGYPEDAATSSVINRFNPTLNFRNYMIPALMVMLIIIICGFLPALNIAEEKETGTIEAMNVTPVSRFTFVLSKLIPYWVVGLIVVTVGMVIGRLVYGLAPEGDIGLIYLAAILFSLVMSSLGVIVANVSSTMLQSIFIMFAVVMVFQLMGGLFTPISSMPDWARYLTYGIPPRYFIEIMRAVYLKGTSICALWLQYSALGGMAVMLSVIAALTYRKQS